jgi:hypothetical protein
MRLPLSVTGVSERTRLQLAPRISGVAPVSIYATTRTYSLVWGPHIVELTQSCPIWAPFWPWLITGASNP